MSKINQLIIGNGEVGGALRQVLQVDFLDLKFKQMNSDQYDVLHICFPYQSSKFIELVKDYQQRFKAKLVIIHSTVPIGTSRQCQAVHSPIRGVHPNLAEGVRTFVKYFGGPQAHEAAKIFQDLSVATRCFDQAEVTEAIKLWDTTQYGFMIMLEKEIHKWCQEHKLSFDAIYRIANKDYNEGYLKLNRPEVVRPYLNHKDGPIGGHCVIPNAHLLGSEIAKQLLKYNHELEKIAK